MARPEMQEAQRRSVYIMVRLTKEEKEMVKEAARRNMRTPSDYARVVLLESAQKDTK